MKGSKEQQVMAYLRDRIFDPVLTSKTASEGLRQGVRLTIMRMEQHNAAKMVQYFCSAISGTERSAGFAVKMQREGFTRFEDIQEEFLSRFDDKFLRC